MLEGLAHEVYFKLGARMHRLAIAGWEIRVRLKELQAANGAWRVVVSNPTGHTCTVQVRSQSFITVVSLSLLTSGRVVWLIASIRLFTPALVVVFEHFNLVTCRYTERLKTRIQAR